MKSTLLIIVLRILVLFCCHVHSLKIGISKTQSAMPTTVDSATVTEIYSESTLIPSTRVKPAIPTPTIPHPPKFLEFPPKKRLPTTQITTNITTIIQNNATDRQIFTNSSAIHHVRSPYQFCNCNLLANSCDINCCCDLDCPYDALKVFNCFTQPTDRTELQRRLEDFQYKHGLHSCKLNDGWLCVFRTNIHRKEDREMVLEDEFDSTSAFKWTNPELDNNAAHEEPFQDYYQVNQRLQLLNIEKTQIETLKLPFAYVPPHCNLLESIRYLKNFKSSCLVTSFEELHDRIKILSEIAMQSKLLTSPKQSSMNGIILGTESSLALKIQLCKSSESNTTMCNIVKVGAWNNSTMDFNNTYIERVTFKIIHNFTNPLAIVLVYHELEIPDMDEIALWQHYEVHFQYQNKTEFPIEDAMNLNPQVCRNSGPLGYIQGEPIIVRKLLPQDDTENGEILSYFHGSSCTATHSRHNLRVFKKQKGLCMPPTKMWKSAINFGVNLQHQCKVRFGQRKTDAMLSNYTSLCIQLQELINKQLLGDVDDDMSFEQMSQLYISILGKPENDTRQWIQIKSKYSYEEFRPIVGELHAHSASFSCRNMLISAAYEFHIAQHIIHNVRQQALVRNAILDMGKYHDLEFDLNEQIEVPISFTVMFYNLNSIQASNNVGTTHITGILCVALSALPNFVQ